MDLYLVTYDVGDDKRRSKVFETLESYGRWTQGSVFFCLLSRTQSAHLCSALEKLVKADEDQVLVVCLGPAEGRGSKAVRAIGRKLTIPDGRAVVL